MTPGFLAAMELPLVAETQEPAELKLIRAAKRGEQAAFASLVRASSRPVFGLCSRMLISSAEASDAAQETFLKAWQHLHRFDERRPFEVWLLAIARNVCIDAIRKKGRARSEDLDDHAATLAVPGASPEERLLTLQRDEGVAAALQRLDASDREVLSLYYAQKRSTKEIADITGVRPGTVMARLFRAREKIRVMLGVEATS